MSSTEDKLGPSEEQNFKKPNMSQQPSDKDLPETSRSLESSKSNEIHTRTISSSSTRAVRISPFTYSSRMVSETAPRQKPLGNNSLRNVCSLETGALNEIKSRVTSASGTVGDGPSYIHSRLSVDAKPYNQKSKAEQKFSRDDDSPFNNGSLQGGTLSEMRTKNKTPIHTSGGSSSHHRSGMSADAKPYVQAFDNAQKPLGYDDSVNSKTRFEIWKRAKSPTYTVGGGSSPHYSRLSAAAEPYKDSSNVQMPLGNDSSVNYGPWEAGTLNDKRARDKSLTHCSSKMGVYTDASNEIQKFEDDNFGNGCCEKTHIGSSAESRAITFTPQSICCDPMLCCAQGMANETFNFNFTTRPHGSDLTSGPEMPQTNEESTANWVMTTHFPTRLLLEMPTHLSTHLPNPIVTESPIQWETLFPSRWPTELPTLLPTQLPLLMPTQLALQPLTQEPLQQSTPMPTQLAPVPMQLLTHAPAQLSAQLVYTSTLQVPTGGQKICIGANTDHQSSTNGTTDKQSCKSSVASTQGGFLSSTPQLNINLPTGDNKIPDPYSAAQTRQESNEPQPYYTEEEFSERQPKDNLRFLYLPTVPKCVTPNSHGTVTIRLKHDVQVDISLDNAIRLINIKSNIVVAVNNNGSMAAMLHPNGRVYHRGEKVDVIIHDTIHSNRKFAKITPEGVTFSSDNSGLIYLLDVAGLRTTSDCFSNLGYDFSLEVFYKDSRHGTEFYRDAVSLAQITKHSVMPDGSHSFLVNCMKITQAPDGTVSIYRDWSRNILRTCFINGTACISSPFFHCTASLGKTPHLFVRRGERRLHYSGGSLAVRNGPYSAGFDNHDVFRLY